MYKQFFFTLLILMTLLTGEGCCVVPSGSWYSKYKWIAENYFDDPKVVALCKAIEAKDITTIDKLVADGANVNAKGKGNMTPLLWAFPDNRPEVFKRLLEHGADPNVEITNDFNTKGGLEKGDSVLHMAARTKFPNYFKYVMQHGGDPNLIKNDRWKNSPLLSVIQGNCPDKAEAFRLLLDAGADLEYMNSGYATPLRQSISWGAQYDLALQLLDAGASFNVCSDNGDTILNFLLDEDRRWSTWTKEQKCDYEHLMKKLRDANADFVGAENDKKIIAGGSKLPKKRIEELKKIYAEDLAAKKRAKEEKK